MANKAPLTSTVAFRVPATMKKEVEKIYKGFEGRKKLSAKLKSLYATLLQK
jgi:hypothetical protein